MNFDAEIYRHLRISDPSQIRSAAILLRDTVRIGTGLDITASDSIAHSRPMRDAQGEVLAARVFPVAHLHRWWLNRKLALKSPLIAAARLSREPFWCCEGGIFIRNGKRILPEVDLTNFAERALTRCAIVVPVHLPMGQIGVASMVSPDVHCEDLEEIFETSGEMLALYSERFITSYFRTMEPSTRLTGTQPLSRREVECLRWAAVGKTNDDTAVIVDLSAATVRFHIRNAVMKLNAINRDQAVFKASQLGYLPASD